MTWSLSFYFFLKKTGQIAARQKPAFRCDGLNMPNCTGFFTILYHNFRRLFLRQIWVKNITNISTWERFSKATEIWVGKIRCLSRINTFILTRNDTLWCTSVSMLRSRARLFMCSHIWMSRGLRFGDRGGQFWRLALPVQWPVKNLFRWCVAWIWWRTFWKFVATVIVQGMKINMQLNIKGHFLLQ
jgi:hypothetical protein